MTGVKPDVKQDVKEGVFPVAKTVAYSQETRRRHLNARDDKDTDTDG
jgi:hypothetical protein